MNGPLPQGGLTRTLIAGQAGELRLMLSEKHLWGLRVSVALSEYLGRAGLYYFVDAVFHRVVEKVVSKVERDE